MAGLQRQAKVPRLTDTTGSEAPDLGPQAQRAHCSTAECPGSVLSMNEDKASFRKRVADAIRAQADRVEKGGLASTRLECAIDELRVALPKGFSPEELAEWFLTNVPVSSDMHIISIEIPHEAL